MQKKHIVLNRTIPTNSKDAFNRKYCGNNLLKSNMKINSSKIKKAEVDILATNKLQSQTNEPTVMITEENEVPSQTQII